MGALPSALGSLVGGRRPPFRGLGFKAGIPPSESLGLHVAGAALEFGDLRFEDAGLEDSGDVEGSTFLVVMVPEA